MSLLTPIQHGQKVKLADIDPDFHADLKKESVNDRLVRLGEELGELEDLLFYAGTHAVLIVLQGRDTAGKDGTIRHLLGQMNVQSASVASFKVPTPHELGHDFLWRVHQQVPGKGELRIFNRSHYEDVLVVRVHDLAPQSVWEKRYGAINAFEDLLADSNTVVMKFMLHISREEQEQRLREREDQVETSWKLSVGDWKEREHWDAYTQAYEEALSRCSSPRAPWYVVPANRKWFRNLAITETVVETLRPYRKIWLEKLEKVGREAMRELAEYRAAQSNGGNA